LWLDNTNPQRQQVSFLVRGDSFAGAAGLYFGLPPEKESKPSAIGSTPCRRPIRNKTNSRANMSKQISRRTMLRGMGIAVALPWLEAMAPVAPLIANVARAGDVGTAAPVRMAFLYAPNGMHMNDWKPSGPEAEKFKLKPILKPVEKFRSKMNILSGLSLDGAAAHGDGGGDHARSVASFLTGAHPKKTHGSDIRNGISVDQVAAEHIGHMTRLKSLEVGTEQSSTGGQCDTGYSCLYTSNISWRTERSPLSKEVNPAAIFNRLFGPEPQKTVDNRPLATKAKNRKSILDFVMQEAKILHNDLGVTDRRKLDEYLYAVRDIERRIGSSEKLDQVETDLSSFQRPIGVPRQYDEHVKLLMDMMVLAFQSDCTRVASFMFANAGSNRAYTNLAIKDGHHNISHHGNSREKKQKISEINTFHMSLTHHFLTRLDAIPEGNGTLLDNCMVLHGSGIADGNSHSHKNLPIALFGSGGGTIKTGRHIQLRSGTPLTNLYRSMLQRVGAPVEKFSDSNGLINELA